MSAQTNDKDPIITISNYEEYLLMYVDNELTPQERGLVEAFLQFHPELQAELDLLMGTKLQPEVVQFAGKENLFAQGMANETTDENLLLYVDGELNEKEEKEIAEKLHKNEAYQQQYQWLLRTKSDPSEVLPYPAKEELYRRTVRRIGLPFALRIAAAVLLLASMGILYLQQNKTATSDTVAVIPKTPVKQKQPHGLDNATAHVAQPKKDSNEKKEQAAIKPEATTTVMAAAQPARNSKMAQPAASPKKLISTKVIQVQEDQSAIAYEPVQRNRMPDMQTLEPVKKESEPDVTSEAPQPYHTTDATAKATFAVDKEEGRNRGNLKSLLRKATRMVERRTGINATNEDEELLIGVVALKLK